MTLALESRQKRFFQESGGFRITAHPAHNRLYRVHFAETALRAFFAACAAIDVQQLEYVPYMRFIVARALADAAGPPLRDALRAILCDRASGGFATGAGNVSAEAADYVKLATAVSHLVGPANHDAMSGTYYARFIVQDTDASDSYLRQAYRTLTLHTDGTFVDETTDWLLLMKFAERHAAGGESRLLHLDDWDELTRFVEHPLARHPFAYKPAASKNVGAVLRRTTFYERDDRPCLCFIDQFAYPETIAEAAYLQALSASMEGSAATTTVALPVGDLFMLNNGFWIHGRAAFRKHPEVHRELMRQRGAFAKD
ncbi:MAG: glutarate dioxygenase GlaH [Candidatus Velthaea sp.]